MARGPHPAQPHLPPKWLPAKRRTKPTGEAPAQLRWIGRIRQMPRDATLLRAAHPSRPSESRAACRRVQRGRHALGQERYSSSNAISDAHQHRRFGRRRFVRVDLVEHAHVRGGCASAASLGAGQAQASTRRAESTQPPRLLFRSEYLLRLRRRHGDLHQEAQDAEGEGAAGPRNKAAGGGAACRRHVALGNISHSREPCPARNARIGNRFRRGTPPLFKARHSASVCRC